jgi:DNA-binding MarR family transcriptional regulator/CheY-like chemotaxis protein
MELLMFKKGHVYAEIQPLDDRGGEDDDELKFAEETELQPPDQSWKILIVDDETEVHEVTKLALSDVTIEGRSLSFISAYSAAEAKQMIQAHPDTAIIFLDVVMETDNAGLEVIDYVRHELGNGAVRIILRTGQPGQAPETVVSLNYGIDDYRTKTELTSQKLLITVVTALRTFATLTQEREKIQQLERSLALLQQSQLQPEQREKIETLGQLVTEVTQDIMNTPNGGSLAMMSKLTRLARMILRITDEQSAKLGLSQSKLSVLMYLNNQPDFCSSPSQLAKHCGISRAAMTGLLDGLEHDHYIERDSHPSDRRALMVTLTSKGQQFIDWIVPEEESQLSDLMGALDESARQKLVELANQALKLFEK